MSILIPYVRQGHLNPTLERRKYCFGGNSLVQVTAKSQQQQQRAKAEHCLAGSKFVVMKVSYSAHEGGIGVEQRRDCHLVFSVQTCPEPVFLHVLSLQWHTLCTRPVPSLLSPEVWETLPHLPSFAGGSWTYFCSCGVIPGQFLS